MVRPARYPLPDPDRRYGRGHHDDCLKQARRQEARPSGQDHDAGSDELAQKVCKECSDSYGVKAMAYKCNVADFEQTKETVAAIKNDLGNIGILVNNAGITRDGLIATMKEAAFDEVIDTNLKGSFNLIRHVCPLMIRGKYGRIINISSVSGIMGNPGQINYSASKAGVIGLTKTTARELASKGITCNAIAPGFIATDMTKDLAQTNQDILNAIPLKRAGTPEDIAGAVAFLVTADYVTGDVIRVDGGMAI